MHVITSESGFQIYDKLSQLNIFIIISTKQNMFEIKKNVVAFTINKNVLA